MSSTLLLATLLALGSPSTAVQPEPARVEPEQGDQRKQEYEQRRQAAGNDVQALWELHLWCEAYGLTKESASCLRAIVRVEPNHREARERLGHIQHDGRWFTNEKELEKYKKEQEERVAKEKGYVKHKGRWVPPEDLPFLEKGLVRDAMGRWLTPQELERIEAGWERQDLEWIPPEDLPKVEQGLWKCGDQWLDLAAANRHHAELDRWWLIPAEGFLLHSTCDREIALKALEAMELARRDLARIFGRPAPGELPIVLLRSLQQFNEFAAGVQGVRAPAELSSLSSIHHAYFADGWIDPRTKSFAGAGVAYWDAAAEHGDRFGPLAVRHAVGLAYAEALDPSPKARARIDQGGVIGEKEHAEFWAEKKLPEWLRSGAASYAERYFVDSLVKAGGNPHWAREWSVSNIQSRGGLRPLQRIFDGRLDSNDVADSQKLLNERGLVVAFVVDGECAPVVEAHRAFQADLAAGKPTARAIERLVKQVLASEGELRKFAGL